MLKRGFGLCKTIRTQVKIQSTLLTVQVINRLLLPLPGTIIVSARYRKHFRYLLPVIVDFTAQGTCATKPSIFQETTIAGPDPATSWSWDFDGTPTVGSPVQHVFQNVGNYTVRLYSTRQSGCVYSATKLVNVIAPPVAQFSMSPVAGAPPLPVEFTNISVGASSFLWKFNDVNNSTSTLFSPSFTYTTLGEYPVDLIVRNTSGCTDTTQKIVQVVIPQINVAHD
jgi:PKD repeat protein